MDQQKRAERDERVRLLALVAQVGKVREWRGEYRKIVMRHHTGTDRTDELNADQLRRFLVSVGSDPNGQIDSQQKEAPRRGYRNSNQRTMANHQR